MPTTSWTLAPMARLSLRLRLNLRLVLRWTPKKKTTAPPAGAAEGRLPGNPQDRF
jgi:hypothetical protein